MTFFVIFIFYSMIVFFVFSKYENRHLHHALLNIGALYLTFILGARGLSVGIDTFSYYTYFFRDIDWNEIGEYYHYMGLLYWYPTKAIADIFSEFQIITFLTAIIDIYLINKFIIQKSPYPMLSYFIYVSCGFYAVGFNLLRQYLAMSFILITLMNLMDNDKKKASITFLVAFLIHQITILFLPIFYLYKYVVNWKVIIIYILSGIGIIFFLKTVMSIISEIFFGGQYLDFINQDGGGILTFVIYVLLALWGIARRKKLLENSYMNNIYLHMAFCAVIIQATAFVFPLASRTAYIFSMCFIVFIPVLINTINNLYIRYATISLVILLGWYAYFYKFYNLAGIYPYKFFFD